MPTRSEINSQGRTVRSAGVRRLELARAANLGPKSAAVLARTSVFTLAQLKQLGAVRAYHLAKCAEPSVTLNLLWALEGAILGQHWQSVAKEHRASLLLALEDYQNHVVTR